MKSFAFLTAVLMTTATTAMSQDVGPVTETFRATYVASGPGCKGLLVTGQFLAATPGYTISLGESSDQSGAPTSYSLDMNATPPSGAVIQVLTLTPVVYEDASFDQCPYGVTITYEDETFIVPLFPS